MYWLRFLLSCAVPVPVCRLPRDRALLTWTSQSYPRIIGLRFNRNPWSIIQTSPMYVVLYLLWGVYGVFFFSCTVCMYVWTFFLSDTVCCVAYMYVCMYCLVCKVLRFCVSISGNRIVSKGIRTAQKAEEDSSCCSIRAGYPISILCDCLLI